MFTTIIMSLLRSGLKLAGSALLSSSINIVEGLPVVHNIQAAAAGVALAVAGVGASMLHSVKAAKASGKLVVESGPIYRVNN